MNSAELKQVADHLRMTAVDMVYKGKDGHPGPALSIADIMAVLFFDEMRMSSQPRLGGQRPFYPVKRPCMPYLLCGII